MVGGKREFQEGGGIHIPMTDFMLMHGRKQHYIVK